MKILFGSLLRVIRYKVPSWWCHSFSKLLILDTGRVCANSLDDNQTGHLEDLAHDSGLQKKGSNPQ